MPVQAHIAAVCRSGTSNSPVATPWAITPPKPGMLRVDAGTGNSIKLELWALSAAAFGKFVAAIPPPLGIGTIRLADGRGVKGFVVEPVAIEGARDISSFGGWRAFMAEKV